MIRTRGKLVDYGELWFDERLDPPRPDILIYRQRSAPVPDARCSTFRSLVTDLSVNEQELWQGIDRGCRYDIRRAEKDGVTCGHETAPLPATINAFERFFDAFADDKSLVRLNSKWLLAAAASGQLFLSFARLGNEVLVWHSQVGAGSVARLLHSCSLRRHADAQKSQTIGRANRLLHWRDLLEFRRFGFHTHDWGGLFLDESVSANGKINAFKRQFGGEERDYYDCTVGLSVLGRTYLPLRSALRSIVSSPNPKKPASSR